MTGEECLVEKVGAYLPGAYEEVVDTLGMTLADFLNSFIL